MSTELVGIVNATPDSFSGDGSLDLGEIMNTTQMHIDAGVAFVDIGAQSTRPGATEVDVSDEWRRLGPVLHNVYKISAGNLSIDTFQPEIVTRAYKLLGKFIVNDVTCFSDPVMQEVIAQYDLDCILSHLPKASNGNIKNAHDDKPITSVDQVEDELLSKRDELITAGIAANKIILDPGIGFGKPPEINWKLLKFAALVPDSDVMIGYSRKKFLGPEHKELAINLYAGSIAVAHGARYLRVHDSLGHQSILV